MDTKICNSCSTEYPKTEEYFFSKVIKQRLKKSGKIATYYSFRSKCKKCHKEATEKRRVENRCKELGCSIEDYRKNWKQQYTETRTIDLEAKEKLTPSQYNRYLRMEREGKVKNYIDYLYWVSNKRYRISKTKIKNTSYREIQKYRREYYREDRKKLKDAYITNGVMGVRVSDVPKEIIETRRLLIQLKKEINYEQ